MDSKKIAIWVLSIVLAGVLVFGTILFLQNRKMKKQISNPDFATDLQKFINGLPIYLDNADAKAHGLVAGDKYRKSATATDYEIVSA